MTGIVLASSLRWLLRKPTLGHNQQERLDLINARLAAHNKNVSGSHIKSLRLGDIVQDTGWAELKGKAIKAASTRHLVPFVRSMVEEFCRDPNSAIDVSTKKAVQSLDTMYNILYNAEMFLKHNELTTLADTLSRLGRHHQLLRHLCEQERLLCWQVTPKVHYCQHIEVESRLINMRYTQNYAEESLQGVVANVWGGSNSGPWRDCIQKTALLKYCVVLVTVMDL